MKTFINTAFLVLALVSSSTALAHAGHDEPAPPPAPHGGQIKALPETYVELASKGTRVAIYLYDLKREVQDPKLFELSAEAIRPREKGSTPVKLNLKPDFAEGEFDAKGLHRYTLRVKLIEPKSKHRTQVEFTVEPRG